MTRVDERFDLLNAQVRAGGPPERLQHAGAVRRRRHLGEAAEVPVTLQLATVTSPRSRNRHQVRGGFGLFHGRTPYVWLSNQYSNTGNEFQRIQVFFDPNNRIPFSADPDAQPTDIGSASTNEISLVDPDYRFPQLLRGNLAYDRDLGFFGLVGSVELLFSKTVCDIDYRNLNLVASGAAPDGRPTHSRLHRDFSNVVLFRNTDQGGSWPWRRSSTSGSATTGS